MLPAVFKTTIPASDGPQDQALGLVHKFRFSTDLQVPIIAVQNGGTQKSVNLFTQPCRWTNRKITSRLTGCSRSNPILCPVTGLQLSRQWCKCCLQTRSHTSVFTRLYPSIQLPLQCQQNAETVESFSGEDGRFGIRNRIVNISGGSHAGFLGHEG